MDFLIVTILGYLIGSVPFAYIIGTVFYKTDIREHGSGNLGGTNAGRVLGKKAGLSVMILDLLKVTLSVFLAQKISTHPWNLACASLAAAVGHCYPVYVHFRGGKSVAVFYGFLLSLWFCGGYSPWIFFLPLAFFLLCLVITKIVSLSSIAASLFTVVYVSMLQVHPSVMISTAAFSILIILRHQENIRRLISGTERKITWIP